MSTPPPSATTLPPVVTAVSHLTGTIALDLTRVPSTDYAPIVDIDGRQALVDAQPVSAGANQQTWQYDAIVSEGAHVIIVTLGQVSVQTTVQVSVGTSVQQDFTFQ